MHKLSPVLVLMLGKEVGIKGVEVLRSSSLWVGIG